MATRHERVVLTLEDNFTSQMAQAAAATALLNQQLSGPNGLNSSANDASTSTGALNQQLGGLTNSTNNATTSAAGLNQQVGHLGQSSQQTGGHLGGLGNQTQTTAREFDRASGRVRLLADALLTLGPALIPIGAVAVPALTGLASQAGIAVAAVGTLVLAFQGVGDAVTALNDAALEPTTDNLIAAHDAMSALSPEARHFAAIIGEMRGEWTALRDSAASGFFPQVTGELKDLDPLLERVQTLLYSIGQAAGVEASGALNSLNSSRWTEFFEFLEREAAPTLRDIVSTVGDFTHGLANMWMAFQPLNRDFGDWLAGQAEAFDEWSQNLDQSESFQEFVDYIRDNGPRVAETFSAIGDAVVDIVSATAPLGGPVLEVLGQVAEVVSAIASSDFGTPLLAGLAAMTLLRRGAQATAAVMGSSFVGAVRTTAAGVRTLGADWRTATAFGATTTAQITAQQTAAARLRQTLGGLGKGAALMGGLAIAASGAADGINLTNTMSLGLMGLIAGPWGGAVGAGVGLLMDFSAASDAAGESQLEAADMVEAFRATLDKQSAALTDATRDQVAFALAQADMGDYAETLGLSMSDLTDLVLASDEAWASWYQTNGAIDQNATEDEINALSRFLDGMGEVRSALSTAREQQADIADATNESTEAYDEAAAAIDRMATAFKAWNDLLSGRDAVVGFERAMADLNATVAEGGLNLDRSSEAGLANYEALTAAAQATMTWVDTLPAPEKAAGIRYARDQIVGMLMDMGASATEADAWANSVGLSSQQVETAVDAASSAAVGLYDTFAALPGDVQTDIRVNGIPQTSEAVDALRQKYNLTPDEVETLMRLQSGAAETGIRRYGGLLAALPSQKLTTITTRYRTEGRPAPGTGMQIAQAAGGFWAGMGVGQAVRNYASGGADVANGHVAEMARPTTIHRVWAEPETQGESYIPHANDWRRPRAKAITEQTAALFGGQVQWFADGGSVRAERSFQQQQVAQAYGTTVVSNDLGLSRLVQEQGVALQRATGVLSRLPDVFYRAIRDGNENKNRDVLGSIKTGGRG